MLDTLIIGSGPAGLSSAIYACRAKLNFVIIEKNYTGAGQIANSERVDNYPALYGVNGFELGQKMREHAISLGTKFIDGEVEQIIENSGIYKVIISDGTEIETKTIIYCGGAEPAKLNIPGEEKYTGMGVSYCAVCDGAFFKDKTVAVFGGGDTALTDAVLLSKFAGKVYLIHRRNEFRANKTLQEKVKSISNIQTVLNAVPTEIFGDKKVTSIKINQDNEIKNLSVDGVFVAIGYKPNSKIVKNLVTTDDRGYVIADETGQTSKVGFFVAGDVRKKPLRQVVTAVADGANCVFSVEKYLYNK